MSEPEDVEIRFTNTFEEACDLRDAGYEPIECAFGQYGSVMGPLEMDHHGLESHREGVALRACRDLYGARRDDLRFVVTGTPDADAILAIVALGGLVPKERIPSDFYVLVNAHDTDPIGIDLLQTSAGLQLAWFNQYPQMGQSEAGFKRGLKAMSRLLNHGLTTEEETRVIKSDAARRRRATSGIIARYDSAGHELPMRDDLGNGPVLRGEAATAEAGRILVVQSTVWGFDVWYRAAPIVVSFAARIQKVTIGCPDLETAERLFGPRGLMTVWEGLGRGWGGRETIGGSPRGVPLTIKDAMTTAQDIQRFLIC